MPALDHDQLLGFQRLLVGQQLEISEGDMVRQGDDHQERCR
jgi:hypothetical protein